MYDELTDCRICMDTCTVTAPCFCKDHVHTKCLQEWISVSGNTHCEICTAPYVDVDGVESVVSVDSVESVDSVLEGSSSYNTVIGVVLGFVFLVFYTFCLKEEDWFIVVLPVNAVFLLSAYLPRCHSLATTIASIALLTEYTKSSFDGFEPLQCVVIQFLIAVMSIWRDLRAYRV